MTPRSCVCLWTLLLSCCALPGDTQALCDNNCSTQAVLTTTTTSITLESPPNCNISTAGRNSSNGSISGLTSGAVHEVQLHCLNCCKPVATQPRRVLNVSATLTTSSILVTWTEPPGKVSFYRIDWTHENEPKHVNTTGTSRTITDLTAGTQYSITVTAVAEDGRTAGEGSTLLRYTKPETVLNISVTEITTSSVYLNWTKPEGNNSFYRVKWTDGLNNWNDSVTETNLNVTNLTPGVKYSFTVQSVAGDNTTESEMMTISSYTKPDRPGNVTVTHRGTDSLCITWTLSGGKSYFMVNISNDNLAYLNFSRTEDSSTNFTGLIPGRIFKVTVTAVAGNLEAVSDMSFFATMPTPPGPILVTNRTNSSIQLAWSGPERMEGAPDVRFNIAYQHQGGEMQRTDTTDNNATLSSLSSGTAYSIYITTTGPQNLNSTAVNISSFTLPNPVLNLGARADSTTSVIVYWSEPPGVQPYYKYLVEVFNATEALVKSTTVSDNGTRASELEPGSEYNIRVTTIAESGISSAREETLGYTMPSPVADLSVAHVNTTSIELQWARQNDHKPSTIYLVEASQDDLVVHNDSTQNETYTFYSLNPGSLYKFQVFAVLKGVQSSKEYRLFYTEPEIVLNLNLTEITTSSMYLNWTKPEGNNSFYRVKWTDGLNNWNDSVTETNLNVTNLTPGVKYSFTVQSVAGDNTTESEMMTISSYTKPEIVFNLNLTEITTSSMYLNWTKPEGNNSFYRVKWTDGLNNWNDSVTETNLNVTNLTPGVKYSFTVQCVAGDNTTESEMMTISSYTKPEIVLNLNLTEITTSSMYLNWTKPEGNNSFYRVKWTDGLNNWNDSVTETNLNVTNLTPGVKYSFTVQSVAGDNTTESEMMTISSYTKPEIVLNISVTEITTSSVYLNWTKPEGNNSFYRVKWTDGLNNWNDSVTETNLNVTNLTPGVKYSFTVQSVAGDNTTESEMMNISSYTKPETVLNLNLTEITTSSMYLNWTKPEGNNSFYRVKWTDGLNNWKDSVTETNLNVTNLTPGVKYSFTVQSVAGDNTTESEMMTISSYTKPEIVLNISVTEITTSSVYLNWTKPEGNNSFYRVKWTDGLNNWNDSVTETNLNVTNLTPGVKYSFTVQSVAGDNTTESEMMNISSYTKPEVVSRITVTGDTTDLSVSWGLVSGQVSSYAVQLDGGEKPQNRTDLSNETTSTQFNGLKPGVDYCVVLVTKSGPHAIKSLPVCNATFPTPPGPITVQSQTATSINFTWTFPLDMNPDQCNFSVTTVNGSFLTDNNWYLLENLQSGSPYDISVATVGVRNYESAEETALNYTRPYSVTDLTETKITTDTVTLEWNQPEAKSHYSYLVQVSNKSTDNPRTVLSPNVTITELQSGSNFSFSVTTRTADGTEAEPVTVSYFTRPHPVQRLDADTLSTTAVRLNWSKPPQYKDYYLYWVEVTGCSHQNINLTEETVEISELNPGTNCTFCVSVEAEGFKGEKMCTSEYTKPETVQPNMFSRSNDSIQVSWTKPEGNVDKYQVNLSRSSSDSNGSMQLTSIELNSNSTGCVFENLSPGRLYSAVVIVHSGPFSAPSALKENATFPNPPGPITILTKATGSIHFRWAEAPSMEGAKFSYQLTLTQLPEGNITDVRTNTTTRTFDSLPSGTSFIISVSTVGILNFESLKVFENVTTRPMSVQSLTTTAGDARIRVDWMKPEEYKDGYRYNLTWEGPDGAFGSSIILNDIKYTVDELDPGSRYNISVTTETSDGTQAEPQRSSNCTRASPVKSMTCRGPNEDNAQINLSWLKPNGQSSGFRVSVNDTEIQNTSTCCSRNIFNLLHYTEYKIAVETLSCGQASTPEILNCTTGITNPPIPSDYESKVKTVAQGHNKFSISINSSLFDPVKGPITHVGVLVTKSLSGACSDCTKYLLKTYNDFKDETAQVYLATVMEVQRSRSSQELSIHVGDNAQWEGYSNGALEAQTKYQYAIAVFTHLTVRNHLVDGGESLVSFTDFTFTASLSVDPAVIGIAVGSTLGIFCILFIILIGFIIFWRRISKKESPEIQIHSLRAKVSAPVRVEDYETNFMKQRADSNCGFAEEFEDLKTVGTAQEKIQALSVENKPKNRYTNVLPYDSSRVKLSIIRGSPSDDYINANYMPGYNSRKEFIAAQGPLPATVNDFWRMIWEKNVQTLVMLTRCNEQGRIKCEQYWNPGTKHFGDITVTTASEIPLDDWTIRDFTIKNVKTAETRSVRHFHFTAWPDHGVPDTTELLITFRHLVREHMNQYSRHSPTVVHCSAGVGRTGTFIAIDHLIFQIERENIVDVYGIVHGLRMHRALMVQTEDQYVFLNQCALDIIRSRTGTNVDLIYQNAAALSIYENLEPHRAYSKSRFHDT